MAEKTGIQWCHHTLSPWRGCSKVSAGCAACYAEALSKRFPDTFGVWGDQGVRVINRKMNELLKWDRAAAKAGERRRNFPSVCDCLEDRPELDAPRADFLALIARTPNLDHLLLTKRPENFVPLMERIASSSHEAMAFAREWLDEKPPANVWFGVSAENQEYADRRIPIMGMIPAALRWVSYEPALGPVDFRRLKPSFLLYDEHYDCLTGIKDGLGPVSWIVVGGESSQGGKEGRPFDVEWARSTVEQGRAAGTPVFVKQLGANLAPGLFRCPRCGRVEDLAGFDVGRADSGKLFCTACHLEDEMEPVARLRDSHGGDMEEWPADLRVRELPQPEGVAA
ncbi:DUF5131 family protein [Paludisphaera soli]|uniref:DUF5131 family protein n=1 Tax=Paludisphaera soli TaxID=2712865 RepID=UPI0013EA940A|nr:DUF5131 family protein [Paludisphaera soli]